MVKHSIVIVGGGPAGMAAAIPLTALLGMEVK